MFWQKRVLFKSYENVKPFASTFFDRFKTVFVRFKTVSKRSGTVKNVNVNGQECWTLGKVHAEHDQRSEIIYVSSFQKYQNNKKVKIRKELTTPAFSSLIGILCK